MRDKLALFKPPGIDREAFLLWQNVSRISRAAAEIVQPLQSQVSPLLIQFKVALQDTFRCSSNLRVSHYCRSCEFSTLRHASRFRANQRAGMRWETATGSRCSATIRDALAALELEPVNHLFVWICRCTQNQIVPFADID